MIRLRSRRVVTPDGERAADIVIDNGVITGVYDVEPNSTCDRDFGDVALLPGLVDTHVHINEPGRTEWEGFVTGTRAAAAGGVTTIIDMPLNSIPATIDMPSLKTKVESARGRVHVDVGFWAGVVPGNRSELPELLDAGVFGFKCFMINSGVPEFAWVQPDDLRRVGTILRKLGAPLLAHAEWPFVIEEASQREEVALGDSRKYSVYLHSRPPEAELQAIEYLIDFVREYGCRVHIVHLAAPEALEIIASAREEGLPITVETCPHYLTFAAEDIADGATQYKCAPPIRERVRRELLWDALRQGTIQMVVSDHSPCPPVMKQPDSGDFLAAWGGIASLQLGLRAVWTGVATRGFTLVDVAKWMSAGPAELAGMTARKGAIAAGRDADIVAFDADALGVVDAEKLEHRHKVTPYDGMQLRGRVVATYLRGAKIYENGEFADASGKLLRRME